MSFSQPALGPLVSADLTGRVVLVTGANTGLGLAASKHLATMNPAKLIMAVRSRERGEKALQGTHSFFPLDLSYRDLICMYRVDCGNRIPTRRNWSCRLRKLRVCKNLCSESCEGKREARPTFRERRCCR